MSAATPILGLQLGVTAQPAKKRLYPVLAPVSDDTDQYDSV